MEHPNQDTIVIGLLYGDETKGATVDWLASRKRPETVVRFSGGPQTAHNVVTPTGEHHTFAMFGSASFQQIPTTLTRFALINPFNLVKEGGILYDKTGWNPFAGLQISGDALLITPMHVWLNRKREEARGDNPHGSCGQGIGETQLYKLNHPGSELIMEDLLPENRDRLETKLSKLLVYVQEQANQTYDPTVHELMNEYSAMMNSGLLNIVPDERIISVISHGYHIFEGSQGVLLDEDQGFHPHTTWSTVTSQNAQVLLEEAGKSPGFVLGVLRSYMTRHGAGPFNSEIPDTAENTLRFPEPHNQWGLYQGSWRRGWLDLPALEYASRATKGVDAFMLSHCDVITPDMQTVTGYNNWTPIPTGFYGQDFDRKEEFTKTKLNPVTLVDAETISTPNVNSISSVVSEILQAPLYGTSYGPTRDDRSSVE